MFMVVLDLVFLYYKGKGGRFSGLARHSLGGFGNLGSIPRKYLGTCYLDLQRLKETEFAGADHITGLKTHKCALTHTHEFNIF